MWDFGDGNDAVSVFEKVSQAVSGMRTGSGPFFFEFSTYRWREHCGHNFDNDLGYRTVDEYELWKQKDPVFRLLRELVEDAVLTEANVLELDAKISKEVEEAFAFAEASPFPEFSDMKGVYA